MNCSHRKAVPDGERTAHELLEQVRVHFYAGSQPARFHHDRRMLLYAVTWPAVWMERRGLFCSQRRYRTLIEERLDAIRAHGEPARYGAYFPAYLLKCLQDFFERHGDDLYIELKHIRNALESLRGSLVFAERASEQSRRIEALAAAHRILHASRHASSHPDPAQPSLF
jgi:hypothetical protein